MLTHEDELDLLHQDLGQARRRVHTLDRAPYEGRVANEREWQRSLHYAVQRVHDLERELAEAQATQREQDLS